MSVFNKLAKLYIKMRQGNATINDINDTENIIFMGCMDNDLLFHYTRIELFKAKYLKERLKFKKYLTLEEMTKLKKEKSKWNNDSDYIRYYSTYLCWKIDGDKRLKELERPTDK